MFSTKLLRNEIIRKIDCPGCYDHMEVSLSDKSSKRSCVMIKKYMDLFAARIKSMKVYEDDVWVVTFPKCGTTWAQEMIWLINNDLNYKTAYDVNLNERFPFLELHGVLNKFNGDSVRICENLPRPRHIKSHLPIFLLPNQLWTIKPKIIYVARNPKDVATSFFHHYRHIVGYEGLKSDFIKAFLNDQVIYAPFNEHVLDFWQIRNQPNILFIHYEDMKRNMTEVIIEASKFFGKKFTTEEIQKLCEHLSVESMRGNSSCNNDALVIEAKKLNDNGFTSGDFKFIRKGQVGSFKDEFSNEIDAQFETFMQQSCLIENGFEYKI